ncbi:hypothetical protein [Streptomyces lancefieldiae]|uniref:Lipoprotein n=1 Tax=Streptomyces lancefieldiae TaxID=3075520 RepID=A0ABU3ALQ8_9ACTN|nr:hypothetical protein [Streptomyces sp. DSM 40712]MDT0610878.1 hypothetical protein [Streptomyces sp. DSM 40712]
MRGKILVAVAALAAVALSSGCSSEAADDGGLPSADSMKAAHEYVNTYAACGPVDPNSEEGSKSAAAKDPAWSIEERGVCEDASGRTITLLRTKDMAAFQRAVQREGGRGLLVGQDFAVEPTGDESIAALLKSDLMYLNCDPDDEVPSGYEKEEALVDGCWLTKYVNLT